jgi:hypothetical protein
MKRDQIIETRQALVSQLPVTGEILRGSLLERTVRHARGCATCARGEGHPLSVLTVSYPGGRTRQFNLRREQVCQVRRWAGQLSPAAGGARGDLRTQPCSAASGGRRTEAREKQG